jgi:hypothetical protein
VLYLFVPAAGPGIRLKHSGEQFPKKRHRLARRC